MYQHCKFEFTRRCWIQQRLLEALQKHRLYFGNNKILRTSLSSGFVAFRSFGIKFKKNTVSVMWHLDYLAVSQVNEEKILQASNHYATLKWLYF